MKKSFINFIKAAIISIIVAFIFVSIISVFLVRFGEEYFRLAIDFLQLLTVKTDTVEVEPELQENQLINYPAYGTKYGNLKIEKIDLNLPIYFGESYTVLKNGIGHDSSSYFPGEGGSVIYMGHNFKAFLRRLPELVNGDIIEVETSYGIFKYEVYDTKIINERQVDLVPIQDEKEILMIYTCYPINNIGHAYQRYVVYASPVEN